MDDLAHATEVLLQGGVVAHATEGVWGFACDAYCLSAVANIAGIKQRDDDKGLIVIAGSQDEFERELAELSPGQVAAIRATWPGPHTWILPNLRFDFMVTGGRDTIACRVPGHPQARALAAKFGGPLISTSANRSGEQASTKEDEVRAKFSSAVDWIQPGQVQNPGVPSSIHQLDGAVLR